MEYMKIVIILYLVVINVTGFIAMAVDKWKAKNHKWRVKEATLFLLAIIGGSIGTWSGMYVFHHKTKHWYFVVGMPAILILQMAVFYYVSIKM